ncbi:alpha/beta fold hydrolase [Aquabacterium sp. OR-4]|uniref:alpha/beta fold hydrolase n=1 Tax=Aquabacterium sp. OR-4 TaxID=2978127 RepID=UPI0021B4D214|nr:alpha/beta hydrolase [Aquabacterium sp. OR-4]MDT7836976.1 alpha/beta hydrolase [Aquabacterium sp. OR-4]
MSLLSWPRRRMCWRLPLLLALASGQAAAQPVETGSRVLAREAVIQEFADAQSRFIDIDGVAVHYKDQGHGPAVLLVHGTLGDQADWDGWAAVLSRRYRVLRLDLPSFGLSGPIGNGNYSVDRMLALVDGFMDEMGAERFAIAGTSYGGLVAFRYAATRSDRISALILANSAGIETGKPPATAASALGRAGIFHAAVVTAADIEKNLRHVLADPALVTPLMVRRKLAFANIRGRGEESVAGRVLYERGNPQRVLAHARAPALVLWGAANQALDPRTADAFVAAMKNACSAERIVYRDAGHLLIVDKAVQSATDAMAFLDRSLGGGLHCRTKS